MQDSINNKFTHRSLSLTESKPLVYTALSKHLFYYRMFISKFVLEQGCVPLNPFMIFDYFMLDTVVRDLVRQANNNLMIRSDELWVFGAISDGVFSEIKIMKALEKNIKFFNIQESGHIVECSADNIPLEDNVEAFRQEL